MEASTRVNLGEIEAARDLLAGITRVTPVETSRVLEDLVGGQVWLKCENLQRTGSFKLRGAYVRISRLSEEERSRGVVAASAGNHAQGVALAAQLLGAHTTVFMPEGAPIPKVAATASYGAEIRFVGTTVDEGLVQARKFSEQTGAVLIHPFDHPDIVLGQGTLGLELAEQCPGVRTVVVSAGGAGLLSGVAVAIKSQRPDVTVVGVQAEGAAALPQSLAAGRPEALKQMATMADGIAVGCPGELTYDLVEKWVDRIDTVSEEALSQALLLCLERAKLVVEPAGAAAVAAVMSAPERFEPPVAAVLSGGNVDPVLLLRVLRHGLAASGRYLSCRLRIPDRPGALAGLLAELAANGANVLDIEHQRTGSQLHVDEVEVAVQLETRGEEHCAQLLDQLRATGYTVIG